ncbi:hypothetical protein ACIOHS_47455 [Streptomyces sp. NPDC088253]
MSPGHLHTHEQKLIVSLMKDIERFFALSVSRETCGLMLAM